MSLKKKLPDDKCRDRSFLGYKAITMDLEKAEVLGINDFKIK